MTNGTRFKNRAVAAALAAASLASAPSMAYAHMKRPFAILAVIFGLLNLVSNVGLASASTFVPPTSNRLEVDFNANWLYVQGDVANAQLQSFNDSSWTGVGLPHTTKFVSPENPKAYIGVSWYRKHFPVNGTYAGRKIFVAFGAAMQAASVYINGTLVVQHNGGYTPFTADATSLLNYGGADNVIAVRLDSTPNSNFAPGNSNPDFQYHGGLYRDVKFIVSDPLHVTDAVYANKVAGGGVFVTYPSVNTSSATVNVLTDVLNENGTAQSVTLVSTLTDANNNIVATATSTASISAGTDNTCNQNLVVSSPQLWNPNTPYLYTLHTVVQEGATTVDYLETQIGIRSIQWTHNNGLLINGVSYKLRGADFHQDIYGEGNAMPDRTVYYDVKRFKDAGFDFVRGSHFPHNTAFYDACDQLGVLVMDCQPGWQYFNNATTFMNSTFQDCRDMIRRDRNHPSVVLWETSLNETNYPTTWATTEQSIAHAEYPGNQMFTSGWITTAFDTLCSSEQAGARSSTDTRPIIIDEYGDWIYGGDSAGNTSRVARESTDANLLAQCNNFESSSSENQAVSWFSADGLWVFADYTGFDASTTKCGVMDNYRLPKFSYYFYQSQRDLNAVENANVETGPMVFIANEMRSDSPTAIRVFSNCQQVSLYINGALFATQSPDNYPGLRHPPFTFNVPNKVIGTIVANGIVNGAVACSYTQRTPGAPTHIVLQAEGTDPLLADGGDARLVFVSVLDANNQVVPTTANTVNLSISGQGTILGPTTITMKGGQLATWMQASRVAGTMTLTASGSGLTSASLTLTSQTVPDYGLFGGGIAGTHLIVNQANGLAIDNGSSTAQNTGVIQWGPNGGTQQQWTFTQNSDNSWNIVNMLSGQALDDPGGSTTNGTQMIQWPRNNGSNQKWWVDVQSDGTYKIWNQSSGLALDDDSKSANGTPLIEWTWYGNTNQRWLLR